MLCEYLKRFHLGWHVAEINENTEKKKRELSKEAIGKSRTSRMINKIRKKYGFFCDEFIQREISSKPSYYQGYKAFYFDAMEDYCERMEKQLTPAEALGILVTQGIPAENPRLKEIQANREKAMREARLRMQSPEFRAQVEARAKAQREAQLAREKAFKEWEQRADRDENSLFANPVN